MTFKVPWIVFTRVIHTAIYIVMAASIAYIVYAGIVGRFVPQFLGVALVLVTLECVVFIGNGWKCPLTTVAISISGNDGKDYAPMIPEKLGRYTPTLFGSLFAVGLVLLTVRFLIRQ